MHIRSHLPIKKWAIYGRNQEKTLELAQKYQISDYFFDYAEMLQSDMDTLYIALPNHLHFSFAKQSLEAGKYIILEKPVTSNYQEFQQLRALAKAQDKILIEAVTVHYLPTYLKIKQQLSAVEFNSIPYSLFPI